MSRHKRHIFQVPWNLDMGWLHCSTVLELSKLLIPKNKQMEAENVGSVCKKTALPNISLFYNRQMACRLHIPDRWLVKRIPHNAAMQNFHTSKDTVAVESIFEWEGGKPICEGSWIGGAPLWEPSGPRRLMKGSWLTMALECATGPLEPWWRALRPLRMKNSYQWGPLIGQSIDSFWSRYSSMT